VSTYRVTSAGLLAALVVDAGMLYIDEAQEKALLPVFERLASELHGLPLHHATYLALRILNHNAEAVFRCETGREPTTMDELVDWHFRVCASVNTPPVAQEGPKA
jgi:hypothetical protein